MALYLCIEYNFISSVWVNTKINDIMYDIHFHLSVGVAVEGVVDCPSKGLVIEGIIK
jgi:hypothetical protein